MKRICVTDDDADIRESFRLFFAETAILVEEVADGEALLALLRRDPAPRVVILDRMMPRLDGAGVLRIIAQEPAIRARTAIIYCTARTDAPDPDLTALLTATTVTTIIKPFLLDDLENAIAQGWQWLQSQEGAATGAPPVYRSTELGDADHTIDDT
jgi:CheY-like chemotaxis protein